MDYFEQHDSQDKIYDREVTSFLLRYIYRYKRYLYSGIILVAIITGVSLVVPLCAKIIIDRYVIKSGYAVVEKHCNNTVAGSKGKRGQFILKKLRRGLWLSDTSRFLLKADVRYFSQQEISDFRKHGVFSTQSYILIESMDAKNDRLIRLVDSLLSHSKAVQYDRKTILIDEQSYNALSLADCIALRAHDFYQILWIAGLLCGLFFIQFIASYYQNLTLMKLSQFSMRDLRIELFSRIVSYQVGYFDKNPIGRLVNRVTNDIEVLNDMFSSVLVNLFQDIILLTAIAIIMFRENVYLASAVAITFPVLIWVTWLFRVRSAEKYRKIREITARLNAFLSETISGIRIIQLFVAETKNRSKFYSVNTQLYTANMQQMYVFAIFRPLIDFIKWFCVASVLYFGAQGILDHTISYGVMVLFMQYISNFFDPIADLSEKFDIMISANAAGEKILSVVKADVRIERDGMEDTKCPGIIAANHSSDTTEGEIGQHPFTGAVSFENVWFGYKQDEWVLKNFSMTVKPRQTIAIVGETGAGKSTIISLMTRLYDIQQGTITIDGLPLAAIPYRRLRRNVAVVMQDVFLFSRTIRENIILNIPYDEERFNFVCGITHVDRFINKLPLKDLEPVMERGVTFSSGERQLISFARALYANPSILILDEATSNIDSETEMLIQDAIGHLIENRTSILIAHRLSTVRHADLIVVLDKGIVVESGSHSELIGKKGIYYNLYRLQFQAA